MIATRTAYFTELYILSSKCVHDVGIILTKNVRGFNQNDSDAFSNRGGLLPGENFQG